VNISALSRELTQLIHRQIVIGIKPIDLVSECLIRESTFTAVLLHLRLVGRRHNKVRLFSGKDKAQNLQELILVVLRRFVLELRIDVFLSTRERAEVAVGVECNICSQRVHIGGDRDRHGRKGTVAFPTLQVCALRPILERGKPLWQRLIYNANSRAFINRCELTIENLVSIAEIGEVYSL